MHRLLRRSTLTLVVIGMLATGAAGCAFGRAGASEQSLLAQVNQQRANAGIGPLAWCPALGRAATGHAYDEAAHDAMSHTGSDGSDMVFRAEHAGYRNWTAVGENVALGYGTETAVLAAWMNSPGHRANILNPAYTHVGSASWVSASGTRYWSQDFGRDGTC